MSPVAVEVRPVRGKERDGEAEVDAEGVASTGFRRVASTVSTMAPASSPPSCASDDETDEGPCGCSPLPFSPAPRAKAEPAEDRAAAPQPDSALASPPPAAAPVNAPDAGRVPFDVWGCTELAEMVGCTPFEVSRAEGGAPSSDVPQVEVEAAGDLCVECLGPILDEMASRAASPRDQDPSVFVSSHAPGMDICDYLARWAKYSRCSEECFVIALLYIDRIMKRHRDFAVCRLSVHRVAVAALLVATKFNDDDFYNNAHYARVAGINVTELSQLEGAFLRMIAWDLHVLPEEYALYRRLMADAMNSSPEPGPDELL